MDYSSNTNAFDKLWYCFSNSMSMEQLLKFAVTSKVILSYEIDYLNSFHDRLMQGLWKRSSNGCFCKMDDRHEKLAYIILNEDYEAETEKSLEKLRKLSNNIVAQKVFDEVSEPNTSLNEALDLVCEGKSCISSREAMICSASQVFDELSQPVLSTTPGQIIVDERDDTTSISDFNNDNEKQVEDECVQQHGNEKIRSDGISSSQTQHFVDKVYESSSESGVNFVKEIQQYDALNVLDELPLPTFIKEMAEASKDAELDSIQGDYEPASAVHRVEADHFTHKQQLFETLDALTASYFHGMVSIKANRKHILMLQGLISPNCASFDQTPNEYGEFYNGNSYYLEYPYLQVTIKPSPSFVEISSHVLYKGAMNIYYGDLVWSMISEPIWFYRFVFDPGVLLRWVSNFENFPHSKLCSAIKNHAHIRTLNSCGNSSENVYLMIVHYMDLKPEVLNIIYLFHGIELLSYRTCSVLSHDLGDYNMSTSRMSDQYRLFDPGILVHNTSVSFFTYTLEDKVDFRGEEDTNEECIWKSLQHLDIWTKYNASRANIPFVLVSYVFDPGGFSCYVGQISMVVLDDWFMMRLLFSFKSDSTYSMVIFALIPALEVDDSYLSEYVVAYSLPCDIIMHDLEIIINQAANVHPHMVSGIASHVAINMEFKEALHMFEDFQKHYSANMCILMVCSNKNTLWSIWRAKVGRFDSVWVISYVSQGLQDVVWLNTLERIGYGGVDVFQFMTVWVFDPGGGVVKLKMTSRARTRQFGGGKQLKVRRSEDQIYVFDPGGLLVRLINTMVTNPQSRMNYAMSYLTYLLSLMILEDKDRFKRRVLIHIKNETRGSFVIYPFVSYFPSH